MRRHVLVDDEVVAGQRRRVERGSATALINVVSMLSGILVIRLLVYVDNSNAAINMAARARWSRMPANRNMTARFTWL